jgi:hypothetical protein
LRSIDSAAKARAAEAKSMADYRDYTANARTADFVSKVRAAENQSMVALDKWGEQPKRAWGTDGTGVTYVELNNGTIEKRSGPGSRASRNNNPGNLEASPWTQSQPGYIGTDGRFGVFDTLENGLAAQRNLLSTDKYQNKTISEAITSYAPEFENDTPGYTKAVADGVGVSPDTRLSELSPEQMDKFYESTHKVEGQNGYEKEITQTGKTYGWSDTPTSKQPASQVANTGAYPETTKAIPTTRASFGTKYLGGTTVGGRLPSRSDVVPTTRASLGTKTFSSLGNGLPDDIDAVPTARPSAGGLAVAAGTPTAGYDVPSRIAAGTPTAGYDRPAPSSFDPQSIDEARADAAPKSYSKSFEDKYLSAAAGTPTAGYDVPARQAAGTPTAGYDTPAAVRSAAGTPTAGYDVPARQAAGTPTAGYNAPTRFDQQTIDQARADAAPKSPPATSPSATSPSPNLSDLQRNPFDTQKSLYGPPTSKQGSSVVSSLERALDVRNEIEYAKDMDLGPGLYSAAAPPADDVETQEDAYVDDENKTEAEWAKERAAPASTPTVPEQAVEPPEEKTSFPEKVAGWLIDGFGGLLPQPFGTGFAVVNGGLMLTGNPTIGQKGADVIFDALGENQYQPGSTRQRDQGAGVWESVDTPTWRRFASKYINLDETPTTPEEPESNVGYNIPYVDRPTPKERWIDNRDTYYG